MFIPKIHQIAAIKENFQWKSFLLCQRTEETQNKKLKKYCLDDKKGGGERCTKFT
jgi:hypothetical protein